VAVITFLNQKGGVGKTSICFHLAGTLAQIGRRILIVDADPQSSAAQSALSALRQQERDEMAALLKKYGVTLPSPPAGLQQLQKLAGNAAFRADAAKLAERFKSDLQAWFKTHGANPRSSSAIKAMNDLRSRYESQLKALLAKYGVKLSGDLPLGTLGHGLLSRPGRSLSVGPRVGIPGLRGGGMMDGGWLSGVGRAPDTTGGAVPLALPAL